ncbi:MAG: glutaredoxin [Actinomycetales bacterium]|nr:glutaredoxin [Actinomycetales bacterium]
MTTAAGELDVTVYWRPGCGFCHVLRHELDRAGVERAEVNIWEDPAAAALVRSVARGNETVPTVVVGNHAMVNPSAREVLAAVGVPDADGSAPKRAPVTLGRLTRAGWSLAAAAGWLVLALTHPTTTYHLAPLLTAVAWPLAAARNRDRPLRGGAALHAAIGSALLAIGVLGILALAGALDGPALIGSTAAEESLIMIAAGTLIGLGLLRHDRE